MRRLPLPFALPAALAAALLLTACGGEEPKGGAAPAGATPTGGGADAASKHPDTKAGLEALVATWKAAHKAGDTATLGKLAADIIPTTADLKSVLKDGPATDDFLGKFAAKDLKADDPMIKSLADGLFKPTSPEQTEVSVTTATTEELLAFAKDGAPLKEFHTGMKGFAALAKPNLMWYLVELLEPGKDLGMKFSCFVNVGGRFVFLAKPWQAIPRGDK